MKRVSELISGLVIACLSTLFVTGALAVSLLENLASSSQPTEASGDSLVGDLNPYSRLSATITPTTLVEVVESQPSPTPPCRAPDGWVVYTIRSGETLAGLAEKTGVTSDELAQKNCLWSESVSLLPGALFYLPVAQVSQVEPSATATAPGGCGAPANWAIYRVQPADTLFKLSRLVGVSVLDLQRANCMGTSTLLHTGDSLWVPFVPTPDAPADTPVPTHTAEAAVDTPVPVATDPIEPSLTPEPAPTDTPPGEPTPESIEATPSPET